MNQHVVTLCFVAVLLIGIVVLLEFGRRLGQRRRAENEEGARAGLGAVEGAVFALMGLLVAFTFSGAATRFDERRALIIQEANAIGTAWLRLDLLPVDAQSELRDLFRLYLDSRLAVYAKMPDLAAARSEHDRACEIQGKIWARTMAVCQNHRDAATATLIPALNEMFDIASTRIAITRLHPPMIIFAMLGMLTLMSSLLAGYAMGGGKSRCWIHTIVFAFILSATVYVILDLEFPRVGFIRIDAFDQVLIELRETMK